MGICAKELRQLVIKPCLEHLGYWSTYAENLLLGTVAVESGLGFHLYQDDSRGMGIYKIAPEDHTHIWDHHLVNNADLASKVRGLASQREFLEHPHEELVTNLLYATAIAWMIYQYNEVQMPDSDDPDALADTWVRFFKHGKISNNQPHKTEVNKDLFIEAYQNNILESRTAA